MVNAFLFLRRIRHCAGFGVQSPTDYAFVRGVIYERLPYYAYEELKTDYPNADKRMMWQARLLHRISNYAQTDDLVFCSSKMPEIYAAAIKKGCKRTRILQCCDDDHISLYADKNGTWFIVPDIHRGNKSLWHLLTSHTSIIAFDLYYLGVAFVDRKRFAETHIINPY